MGRIALALTLTALSISLLACPDDEGTGTSDADAGTRPDAVDSGGDTAADSDAVEEDVPVGQARWVRPDGYASIVITIDDGANGTYEDAQIEWNGSFIYDASDNTIVFSSSWLPDQGPFPPFYDDGPYTTGGHEAADAVAGDHIFETEVFFLADEETTFEYGVINELDHWIWVGRNGLVTVPAGETGTVVAQGMTFEAFGSIDMRVTLDTGALHSDFETLDPTTDAVFIKGTMVSWRPVQLLDNGAQGDAAADDGLFTFTLSEYLGAHDGLLRMEQEAQFAFVFFSAEGVEYKFAGDALTNGVTAYSTWDGEWAEEELLLRTESRGQALNTAIIVGPDEEVSEDPVLRFVDPDRGPTTGGTPVALSGERFVAGATVTFGDTAASCSIQSAALISCETPTSARAGVVAVTVTNPDSGSDTHQLGFTYVDVSNAPAITSITPDSGTESGGTSVTIAGGNFETGASVSFDGTLATDVVVSASAITCTTPVGTGTVDVEVRNPDGQTGTFADGFTYLQEGLDYAVLQWPTATIAVGTGETLPELYGRVYEPGITDGVGQGDGIIAQVIIGPDGSDPTSDFTGWSEHVMAFNGDLGNDDEYNMTGITLDTAGTYDWAVRFRFASDATSWIYGDMDGSINGYDPDQAGEIVVTEVSGLRVTELLTTAISILGEQAIVVTGANFADVMTVETRLTGTDDAFTAQSFIYTSPTQFALEFSEPSAGSARTPGAYDLKVTNGADSMTVTDAYLVGYVRTPTIDGTIENTTDDWHPEFLQTSTELTSDWGENALHSLYAAFDEDGLYIGMEVDIEREGGETDSGNVVLLYLDADYGNGTGFTMMGDIGDEDPEQPCGYECWRLDRAITSHIDASGIDGFGADWAFGTFELEPLDRDNYLDLLSGWRGLVEVGNIWWYTFGDHPCGPSGICFEGGDDTATTSDIIETFISWDVLTDGAPGSRQIALFARIVNRNGEYTSNQSLPPEPDPGDTPPEGWEWVASEVLVLDVH